MYLALQRMEGQGIRDLNYVDDVVRALIGASVRPEAVGRTLNLGGPPITLLELAELIVDVNGRGSVKVTPFGGSVFAVAVRH